MIHIAPCNRLGFTKHDIHGTTCECGVTVDWDHFPAIVSHEFMPTDGEMWGIYPETETKENCDVVE